MISEISKDAEQRMLKSIESLRSELSKLRTGRAHPSLLEHIKVDTYGSIMPLNQVSSITIGDPRTLVVKCWDKGAVASVEKAIRNSDLGLNPATAGDVIRVPLPVLTEERRRDLTRIVKGEAENAKVAIRNVRRDANSDVKELLKEKEIGEDDEHRGEEAIQKLTDRFVAEVEKIALSKEAELMEV